MTIDYQRDIEPAAEVEDQEQRDRAAALIRLTDQLEGAVQPTSMLDIAEEQAEALEADLAPVQDDRFDRFPELRDVEVPKGAAALFPELSTQKQPEQGDREREDERAPSR